MKSLCTRLLSSFLVLLLLASCHHLASAESSSDGKNYQILAISSHQHDSMATLGVDPGSDSNTFNPSPFQGSLFGRGIKLVSSSKSIGAHTVFVDEDGIAYGSGNTVNSGQIGVSKPPPRKAVEAPQEIGDGEMKGKKIVDVSCGGSHTLFVDGTGSCYGSGINEYGQLASAATTFSEPIPVRITSTLVGKSITKVEAGGYHSLFLDLQGNVYCAGRNQQGECGIGNSQPTTTPTKLTMTTNRITRMSAGLHHSIFLDSDNTVYVCGRNHEGLLGVEPPAGASESKVTVPVSINSRGSLNGKTITQVVAGEQTSFFLDSSGTVHYTGRKLDNSGFITEPQVLYQSNNRPKVEKIRAGASHVLLLMINKEVWFAGQLTREKDTVQAEPIPLSDVFPIGEYCTDVKDIAASGYSSFVLCNEKFAFENSNPAVFIVMAVLAAVGGVLLFLSLLGIGAVFMVALLIQKRMRDVTRVKVPPIRSPRGQISEQLLDDFQDERHSDDSISEGQI